ncbi:hepatitis A virus cellular receptor 1 isoform X3 [Clupea harengus]|uniref:Hepatitis A virus cellular receptor 1 isoform X3 n=1 Tax=Clupea harengus TaxID=7950 RepID=A0A6P8FMT6_CLUHA|nr:hepatitis A virus cellular receptor 1 isoform X3 [Clupea harengus]
MEIAKKAFHTNNKKTTSIPELKEQKMGNTLSTCREWKSMISYERKSCVHTSLFAVVFTPGRHSSQRHCLTMSAACCCISVSCVVLHLLLCLVGVSTDTAVYGTEGENVTLPCSYNSEYHGPIRICWGTGDIPNMGCNNNIITTDGHKVTSRVSDRFQLLGNLTTGNVSLTIFDSMQIDSGKYFCRIHIPGWFNDEKHSISLLIKKGFSIFSSVPYPSSQSMTTGPSITESHTEDHQHTFPTGPNDTTPQYSELVSHLQGVLVAAVLLLVVAVIVVAVFLMRKRQKKSDQDFQIRSQASGNTAIYSNSVSSVGLFSREMAIENVYHLEETDVYEECPY